jgi:DNA repair exonuclease SbcCD ATPase subunit
MINKFLKLIATISIVLLSITSLSIADDHVSKKEIISELRKDITELGEKPIKRKFLQGDKKYIANLKDQKEELEKEKAKQAKIDAAKEEIVKELEKLGEKPISETKDIDKDEEIIALRKQLDELKKKIKDKEDKEKKEAKEKKLADDKKKEEEKKEAKLKQDRDNAIQNVKKEIFFLGETPLSEFEVNNNDEYIAALNDQLAEIKAIKEQEEKEIQESIPSWFIKVPKGDEKIMYVRGTAVVDTLQGSIDSATNAALRELGKKLETRLNSKIKETVRQAGIGEDIVTKSEMNRVSSLVVKEVTISGYEIADTKLVKLDSGSYRSFILLEYPIAQVYKAFINRVEENEKLKSTVTALKNTEAFKELEQFVAEFSGA